MTTMIQNPEPVADPLAEAKFQVNLEASHSALLKVMAHHNPTLSMEVGEYKILFASLITLAEQLRDRKFLPEELHSGNPHVPNVRRNERLAEAAESAKTAISLLEQACLLMVKAVLL